MANKKNQSLATKVVTEVVEVTTPVVTTEVTTPVVTPEVTIAPVPEVNEVTTPVVTLPVPEVTTTGVVVPETAPVPTEGKTVNTSAAIREAIAALGVEAATKEVREFISARYPTIDMDKPGFGSTLSAMRTKFGKQRPPQIEDVPTYGATIDHLRNVNATLAQKAIKLKDFAPQVRLVYEVSESCGGVANLLKIVEALEEFAAAA